MRLALTAGLVLLLVAPAWAVEHPTRREARKCARKQIPIALPGAHITHIGRLLHIPAPDGWPYRVVTFRRRHDRIKLWCAPWGPINYVRDRV
jgi:hypothetical protein